MSFAVVASGLKEASRFFEQMPQEAEKAMVLAINQVVERDGLVAIRREMRQQIFFPRGYLETRQRLAVLRKARTGSLEAVIRARDRATSLARFALAGQRPSNQRKGFPLKIEVRRGRVKTLKKAFLINLKNGNTGLALRLKPGQRLEKSQKGLRIAADLYLLYGPSVDQVFKDVANRKSDELLSMISKQFLRQFART